jgi:hypothetical protein
MEFVSDAAGLCKTVDLAGSPGCGNIGLKEDGKIIFVDQFTWPSHFICGTKDEKDVRFREETTIL